MFLHPVTSSASSASEVEHEPGRESLSPAATTKKIPAGQVSMASLPTG